MKVAYIKEEEEEDSNQQTLSLSEGDFEGHRTLELLLRLLRDGSDCERTFPHLAVVCAPAPELVCVDERKTTTGFPFPRISPLILPSSHSATSAGREG